MTTFPWQHTITMCQALAVGRMLCWEWVFKATSPLGVYGLVQRILTSVIDVCTQEGVTVSGGMTEEVTFDLGLDG